MRIIHTADWHLGDRLGRIDRTADLRRSVERVASYCEREKADVLLVAGDLFSDLSRPDNLRDSIEHLREVFLPFLCQGGTIAALTGNHDHEGFCQTLRDAMTLAAPAPNPSQGVLSPGRLYLAATPTLLRLPDRTGRVVQFMMLPYPTASGYLDAQAQRYRNVEERNRALSAAVRNQLIALQAHPDFDPDLPTVLAAHIHVQGARLSNLFRMSERDCVLLSNGDLPTNLAYVALGHIHQPQSVAGLPHVRYSGSIERLDLGEKHDDKSVVLLEVERERLGFDPVCLPMPSTPVYDVEISQPREDLPALRAQYPDAEQALVRYHVTYTVGVDNLEEILGELDQIFPRWYDRDWHERTALNRAPLGFLPQGNTPSFSQVVLDYLHLELQDHPEQAALLELAHELLAEEG
jgi:exonuclease SbcD